MRNDQPADEHSGREPEPDRRVGGYGGGPRPRDRPAERPPEERPETAREAGESERGVSAVGRDNPAESPLDADEALGNRSGGYGNGPDEAVDQPDGATGER